MAIMTPQIKQRIDQIQRGEVPEGYKRTKVGIVPEEWDVPKAKEVFESISDKKHDGTLRFYLRRKIVVWFPVHKLILISNMINPVCLDIKKSIKEIL